MNLQIVSNKISQSKLQPKAHRLMIPSFRGSISENSELKESAVAIILFEKNNETYCIYTKRAEHPNDKHSGQISFPGGKRDLGDTNLIETACRETYEEIGLQIQTSSCIKELSPIQIPISNFIVYPFVFVENQAPQQYKKAIDEVDEIIEIPISHLLSATSQKTKKTIHNNQEIQIPYYEFKQHHIWGATAMITAELLQLLQLLQ